MVAKSTLFLAGAVAVGGAVAFVVHRNAGTVATADLAPSATPSPEPSASAPPVEAPPPRVDQRSSKVEILSPVYEVDRIYKSMQGPQSSEQFHLGAAKTAPPKTPELKWITGFKAVMVGADGETAMPQEFMCHSNLDFDPTAHNETFGHQKQISGRLFTLSQGQLEVKLPEGFGIPIMSSEALSLTTQVLNLNHEVADFDVRHKVDVDYVRDRDAKVAMKPLFMTGVYGLQLLEGDAPYFGVERPDEAQHGTGCMMGEQASEDEFQDEQGRRFTGHWVVKPGREVNKTLVTKIMALPWDTTIHYIAVHLHPFAESLELVDLTAKKTVYRATTRQFPDKIGLAHVDSYSSAEGIPVYKDHEYELISVYNNTSGKDQDSMAVMLLYMFDKEFQRPSE